MKNQYTKMVKPKLRKLKIFKQLKSDPDVMEELYLGYHSASQHEKMTLNEGYLRAFKILKQEAIKWIKNRINQVEGDLQIKKINLQKRKIVWNYQPYHYIEDDALQRIQGSVNDFILFFNITEQDLKNENTKADIQK